MAKHRIRITSAGIYGAPTDENPTGEYPIGHEFETDADLPAGWKGRAEVVGEEPERGSEFIVADDDDSEVGKARREIIEKANAEFERIKGQHAQDTRAMTERAEKAEEENQHLREQNEALNLKLKAFDQDGDGKAGGSAPQDPPALSGKNKAELLQIAKDEGVEVEDGATNPDIVSAIELAREEKAKA